MVILTTSDLLFNEPMTYSAISSLIVVTDRYSVVTDSVLTEQKIDTVKPSGNLSITHYLNKFSSLGKEPSFHYSSKSNSLFKN